MGQAELFSQMTLFMPPSLDKKNDKIHLIKSDIAKSNDFYSMVT